MTHEEFLKAKEVLSDILHAHFVEIFEIKFDVDMITIIPKFGAITFVHCKADNGFVMYSTYYRHVTKFKKIEHAGVAVSHGLFNNKVCDQCVLTYDARCNIKGE